MTEIIEKLKADIKKLSEKSIDGNNLSTCLTWSEAQQVVDALEGKSVPSDEEINNLFPVMNTWSIEDKALEIGKRQGAKWMRDRFHHTFFKEGEKWIDVKDRLPENNVAVLVYMPQEKPSWVLGYLSDSCWYRLVSLITNKLDSWPTHWQPLPDPPKH